MGRGVSRVLQVHTRYRQRGGEDEVVEAERLLMTAAGIDVHPVVFDNADLTEGRSVVRDVALAAATVWSESARRRVAAVVDRIRPDVVHVHNTFAAASPSVYFATDGPRRVPVVQTLHNYRLVCPAATTFRAGDPCTDCVGRAFPWPSIVHSCVRGSRAQSATVAAMLVAHRALGTYRRHIAAYIALTDFQRRLLVAGGLPSRRVHVISNFLEATESSPDGPRDGVVFVGRLTIEKGVGPLVDAAAATPGALRVIGTGPLEPAVRGAAKAGLLTALGQLSPDRVREHVAASVALVVPSVWYEGFPMVVLEAFASGTPVIASRIGSLAEIVEDGLTGLLVEPGNGVALAAAIRWALDHRGEMKRMGKAALQRFDERYAAERHLENLMAVYGSLLDEVEPTR